MEFLAFAGIGGLGNFILMRTGPAIGQLILLLVPFCSFCTSFCIYVGAASGSDTGVAVGGAGAMILQGQVLDGNGYMPYFAN